MKAILNNKFKELLAIADEMSKMYHSGNFEGLNDLIARSETIKAEISAIK